ncbi:DUF5959 family protein [Streptomyces sp. NPDC059452]|uniref:DUF5959 family protein n=1 Tax=Streptomyces sp. NPDC059452 TaxID=3346835 RepID=UPI0036CFA984
MELFRFADPGQSATVETKCGDPLLMEDQRFHAAEIIVGSGFVSGRAGLQVSLEDLGQGEQCLAALEAGEGTEWPAGGRSAWLGMAPDDPVEVTVHDSPSTQIAVRIPIDTGPQRLQENRLRLTRTRKAATRRDHPRVTGAITTSEPPRNPHYVFRGPAIGPPASGPGMTVSPCVQDGLFWPRGNGFSWPRARNGLFWPHLSVPGGSERFPRYPIGEVIGSRSF